MVWHVTELCRSFGVAATDERRFLSWESATQRLPFERGVQPQRLEPKAVQLWLATDRTIEPSAHGKWAQSTGKLQLLGYVTPTLGESSWVAKTNNNLFHIRGRELQ